MPETSYNGWTASKTPADFGGLTPLVVAGEPFSPGVRAGDVHTVFNHLVHQLHARVEPVVRPDWHQADDWGFAYRANVNKPSQLSCHASATAIDWNATRHPNGKANTFTAAQVAEIRRILAELGGVIRWGGDFSGTKDDMHFEIRGTAAEVADVAARLRGAPSPGTAAPVLRPEDGDEVYEPGETGDVIRAWQGELWRIGIGVGVHDGIYGPATEGGTNRLQVAAGIKVDGVAGQQSQRMAGGTLGYPLVAETQTVILCAPGAHHVVVEEFQKRLAARGWQLTVDGMMSPGGETQTKLRQFQAEKGLVPADGIGTPDTWVALWTRP